MLDSLSPWWGFRPPPGRRHSILELIVDGTLDADLAALLWMLVERAVPVLVVAGPPMAGKTTLLTAVLDFVPASTELRLITGLTVDGETLDRPPAPSPAQAAGSEPVACYLLVPELSDHLPVYVWGTGARRLVRAASVGLGLAATMHGDRLEDVFEQLSAPPVALDDDELSYLGVVLILGVVRDPAGWRRRIRAAHYVRPVARDAGGHVQRRPPAVLVAWDPSDDAFSHFEWGIADELAARVGLHGGDFEAERVRRAAWLRTAIEAGQLDVAATRAAVASYRPGARTATPDVP